jgi:hypothetical protein
MLKMTILLAEYDLFLIVLALREYFDITALYSVVTLGSLVAIKMIKFVD